ncbi:MAG TPA: UDP-N-acetylmuramoyl-tripeptide--D-alanyl-D-alanine ligase [Lachnospiraceae bacterium]
MKNMTLENIAKACAGIYYGKEEDLKRTITSITTDSRVVEAGALFAPIVGERADGHDYIDSVIQKGGICTLSEKMLEQADYPYILVESTLQALKDIAKFYLQQLSIPVIGVSGSVGKTSTKEMIASVLEEKYCVLKTLGNFNNELGLPLTIFRIRDQHEVAVLEMGISDFGEMSRLAEIAKPDIMVITNIGMCHLDNLKDRDGVFRAKTESFAYLKETGRVILNGEDDKLVQVDEVKGMAPIFFGYKENFDYYAKNVVFGGLKGMECEICTKDGSFLAHTMIPGEHMIYNMLAATAVGRCLGLSVEEIKKGIASCQALGGRNHIIQAKDRVVLDDCYNANPVSMRAGLDVLANTPGRKVAILGDMGELGENTKQLHYEVGNYAGECDIDLILLVGDLAEHMYQGIKAVKESQQVYYFKNKKELLSQMEGLLKKEDSILVKASHFMGFDEIVTALTNE